MDTAQFRIQCCAWIRTARRSGESIAAAARFALKTERHDCSHLAFGPGMGRSAQRFALPKTGECRAMNLLNLFGELKRRNVYKVTVAYIVVAWLGLQAASILLPTFEAPSWVMKALVVIIALGFVFA